MLGNKYLQWIWVGRLRTHTGYTCFICASQVNGRFQNNFKFAYVLSFFLFQKNQRQMPWKAAAFRDVKIRSLSGQSPVC